MINQVKGRIKLRVNYKIMIKKNFLGIVITLLVIGAGCSSVNNEIVEAETIKIGFMAPLSGDAANLGVDALEAAQMAVEEINTDGGINGQALELLVKDSKCLPKEASVVGSKLINVDKVNVIIGPACSGATGAVAPIAEESETVLLSYCSTANSISEAGDYIFRTMSPDAFQGKVAAQYIHNQLNKAKVAVLYVQAEWGESVKQSFVEAFEKEGGEIAIEQGIAQNVIDMRTQLLKIKESGAEAIFFPAYTEEILVGLRQIKELDIDLPIMGADTWEDGKIHESEFAQNAMFVAPSTNMITVEWKDKLKSRGAATSLCAPRAYDNVKLIADLISRVGEESINIKNALYQIKGFPGVQGDISFDYNGDPVTALYDVKIIQDGQIKVIN